MKEKDTNKSRKEKDTNKSREIGRGKEGNKERERERERECTKYRNIGS